MHGKSSLTTTLPAASQRTSFINQSHPTPSVPANNQPASEIGFHQIPAVTGARYSLAPSIAYRNKLTDALATFERLLATDASERELDANLLDCAARLAESGMPRMALLLAEWRIDKDKSEEADSPAPRQLYLLKAESLLCQTDSSEDNLRRIVRAAKSSTMGHEPLEVTAQLLAVDALLMHNMPDTALSALHDIPGKHLLARARVLIALGKVKEAKALFSDYFRSNEKVKYRDHDGIVKVLALLNPDDAVAYLQGMIEDCGDEAPEQMSVVNSPFLKSLHDKQEWPGILASVGRQGDIAFENDIGVRVTRLLQTLRSR